VDPFPADQKNIQVTTVMLEDSYDQP
jgi:hypothetical protein